MSSTMTIRLDDDVTNRLEQMAESTQRSKSFLAATAIREFVETNEWQIAAIKEGVAQADAGDFATDQEVADFAAKWTVNAG